MALHGPSRHGHCRELRRSASYDIVNAACWPRELLGELRELLRGCCSGGCEQIGLPHPTHVVRHGCSCRYRARWISTDFSGHLEDEHHDAVEFCRRVVHGRRETLDQASSPHDGPAIARNVVDTTAACRLEASRTWAAKERVACGSRNVQYAHTARCLQQTLSSAAMIRNPVRMDAGVRGRSDAARHAIIYCAQLPNSTASELIDAGTAHMGSACACVARLPGHPAQP